MHFFHQWFTCIQSPLLLWQIWIVIPLSAQGILAGADRVINLNPLNRLPTAVPDNQFTFVLFHALH